MDPSSTSVTKNGDLENDLNDGILEEESPVFIRINCENKNENSENNLEIPHVEPIHRFSSLSDLNLMEQPEMLSDSVKYYSAHGTMDCGAFKAGKNYIRCRCYSLHNAAVQGSSHIACAATRVAKSVVKYSLRLVPHWELPDWLRDNTYIWHLHRPQLDSFRKCFKSIFSIHTETGNIWTHLIGLLIMIAATLFIYIRPHVTKDGYPHFPVKWQECLCYAGFFIGACTCMTFSWLFHTTQCHSEVVHRTMAKLDYSGIALLIGGSLIPVIYYGFYCNFNLQVIYMSVMSFMAIVCILVSVIGQLGKPKFRFLRAGIFTSFGLSGIIPIVHLFFIYPRNYVINCIALYWVVAMGALYIIGVSIYVLLFPEKCFPGKITIIFQSHQIFHVFVVAAAILHLYALCLMSLFRVDNGLNCG